MGVINVLLIGRKTNPTQEKDIAKAKEIWKKLNKLKKMRNFKIWKADYLDKQRDDCGIP